MSDWTATLSWWIWVQLFGLAALPLALRLFRRLPDHGYGVSKALGLLLTTYVFWLLNVLGFLRNDSASMLFSLVAVATVSLLIYRTHHASRITFHDWLRTHWKIVLITELVFAVSFFGWTVYRAYSTRILTAGGEKFMELAFLNGIRRSETMPPLDPWLSGYAISYYYFGYLMMSALIRLSGVPTSVGFNLGGALLFALTVTGAFSLVWNLVAGDKGSVVSQEHRPLSPPFGRVLRPSSPPGVLRRSTAIALLGIVLVVFLSNYEAPLEIAHWRGLGSAEFWKWLDIADLDSPPPTAETRAQSPQRLVRPLTGPGWGWWWRASRVIFDYTLPDWSKRYDETADPQPHRRENIDEFPFFSFLLGDMHPHVLALPFVLLALTASLSLFWRENEKLGNRELGMLALIFGALGFLNTWDLPIQWAVAVAAFALSQSTNSQFPNPQSSNFPIYRSTLKFALGLGIGALLLYAPFYVGLQSQAGGPLVHVHSSTRLAHFFVMFGPLLLILLPFLAWGVGRARQRGAFAWRAGLWTGGALLGLALGMLLLTAGAIYVSPRIRDLVVGSPSDAAGLTIARHYLGMRLSTPWVTLLLASLIAAAVALLRSPGLHRTARFSLILVAAGGVMTLVPDYIYLKDVFGVRMNTVFKFYFQAWVLWAVAAAGAVYAMWLSEERLRSTARAFFGAWLTLVVGLGLLYPLLAVPDRVQEYPEAPTLDGTAYQATENPADYAAIQWLNENVAGAPVILEKPGGGYDYEGRVSAQTGLPTLLGWAGHEHQWRGSTVEQNKRQPVIEELCRTADFQRTLTLLDEYDITYVYVGPLERAACASGLEKLDWLMDVVYDRDGVTIYKRRGPLEERVDR
jgi:YYY domain-containing protein